MAQRLVERLQILFPFGAPSAEGLAPHIVLGAMLGALAARVQDRSPRPALSFAELSELSAALERASAAPSNSAAAHQPTAWPETPAARPEADAADLSAVVEAAARQRWQQAPPTAAPTAHDTEPPWKHLARKRKHPSAQEEPLTIPLRHAPTLARGAPPCKVRVKEEEVEPGAQGRQEEGGEEGVKDATAEDDSAAGGLSEEQFRALMETLLGHGLPAVLDQHHGLK